MVDASEILSFAVAPDDAGARLDRFLALSCQRAETGTLAAGLSRARLQALLKSGDVTRADGHPIESANAKVRAGEVYLVRLPPPVAADPKAQSIPLDVVYEDRDVIVVNKPAGLVVHPAAGHADGTLVNALIAHCGDSLSGIGGVRRPGIVHRLDKDTSGLLVVAKTDAAHHSLSEQFQSHGADGRLLRRYTALVWGQPTRPHGRVDAALGRSTRNRTKIAVVHGESGRPAVTHFSLAEVFRSAAGVPIASLLDVTLETGRTHQIRVHMAHIGHPVMGDPVYATSRITSHRSLPRHQQAALAALNRQALHAAELGFEHPRSSKQLMFKAKIPSDFAALIAALRHPT